MCVSLVSYRSLRCAAVFAHKADQPNFTPGDVLQYGHPEEWPTDASLFAALDAADGTAPSCSFTLSPPFTQVSLSSPRFPRRRSCWMPTSQVPARPHRRPRCTRDPAGCEHAAAVPVPRPLRPSLRRRPAPPHRCAARRAAANPRPGPFVARVPRRSGHVHLVRACARPALESGAEGERCEWQLAAPTSCVHLSDRRT